eukprot:3783982-Rhodomonas_salina.2
MELSKSCPRWHHTPCHYRTQHTDSVARYQLFATTVPNSAYVRHMWTSGVLSRTMPAPTPTPHTTLVLGYHMLTTTRYLSDSRV